MGERIVGGIIGASFLGLLAFGLWKLGHPYAAMFLVGAAFQHLSVYVFAALKVGSLRFE